MVQTSLTLLREVWRAKCQSVKPAQPQLIQALGMFQTSLTLFREVWRAKPSTKTTNPALVPPECQAGAAETEACLTLKVNSY